MADVLQVAHGVLAAAGSVTAICPAARIKPPGDWQGLARPYIVQWPIGAQTNYTHEGLATLRSRQYQISCFADSYSAARSLADAVIAALTGTHSGVHFFWTGEGTPMFETDVKVHHIPVLFEAHGATI